MYMITFKIPGKQVDKFFLTYPHQPLGDFINGFWVDEDYRQLAKGYNAAVPKYFIMPHMIQEICKIED